MNLKPFRSSSPTPTASTPEDLLKSELQEILKQAAEVILDKEEVLRQSLACILAQGHLLIEDQPGVGKTTLIKTLSQLLGLETRRIQFTNDLLPADLLGGAVFNPQQQNFEILKGPIFTSLVFADELNRATPKSQSALLQAMEERQVSLDGQNFLLPQPFIVMATQNAQSSIGTFALPESQLDRFLMRIHMGHPSREAERALLLGQNRSNARQTLQPLWSASRLLEAQNSVTEVHLNAAVTDYIQDLIQFLRAHEEVHLSVRAALDIVRAAKAWAFLNGRNFTIPEDVQAMLPPTLNHRLGRQQETPHLLIDEALQSVTLKE